ncbi:CBO0543 family protein [Bacillus sp. UNC41MFS5]|uniref:CBO0543 family protein n=1 Tax=Bacillus sp. UNC41MFS5 TaxID=1449046 RepID=UPI003FA451D6
MLWWKIPRNRLREAHLVFLFAQAIGWLYVFIQSRLRNIIFPYREFPYASAMLFSLHYIIYPTFNVLFIMWCPKNKGKFVRIFYSLVFIGIHQLYEFLLERYTNLIENNNWHWYFGILTKLIIYFIIFSFYKWYNKGLKTPNKTVIK